MSKEEKILAENLGWMEEKWDRAWEEQESGELKIVSQWFFDDATEPQLKRIDQLGFWFAKDRPTKGQASDIIGVFESPEELDVEILRFFKIPLRGMNQSKASHIVTTLFLDQDNIDAWMSRPASTMQKEFYKYFDLKVAKSLTNEDASFFIREYRKKLQDKDEKSLCDWDAYEDMYIEINDPFSREDYSIKKVSLSIYRDAIKKLRDEGRKPSDLEDDLDLIVERIVQLKPDIQKA